GSASYRLFQDQRHAASAKASRIWKFRWVKLYISQRKVIQFATVRSKYAPLVTPYTSGFSGDMGESRRPSEGERHDTIEKRAGRPNERGRFECRGLDGSDR